MRGREVRSARAARSAPASVALLQRIAQVPGRAQYVLESNVERCESEAHHIRLAPIAHNGAPGQRLEYGAPARRSPAHAQRELAAALLGLGWCHEREILARELEQQRFEQRLSLIHI